MNVIRHIRYKWWFSHPRYPGSKHSDWFTATVERRVGTECVEGKIMPAEKDLGLFVAISNDWRTVEKKVDVGKFDNEDNAIRRLTAECVEEIQKKLRREDRF